MCYYFLQTAVRESAPVENLYSEPVPKTQNFYPDLSEAPQVWCYVLHVDIDPRGVRTVHPKVTSV